MLNRADESTINEAEVTFGDTSFPLSFLSGPLRFKVLFAARSHSADEMFFPKSLIRVKGQISPSNRLNVEAKER